VPLKDADLLVLAKLALQHWSIRERNCGEFFEVVKKDFQKAINRNFATSRKKVQDLIKKYRGIFKEEGSGTGVNSSEDEIVPVMRELVACSDAEIARNKKKDKQALARAQDKANAVKDRDEMLLRAMDKQRPAYLSGLESDDDEEADQTSIEEDPAPSSPSIVSQSTTSSRSSHGRSRNNAQGKKRARGPDLEAILANAEAERVLRRQELESQMERDREERREEREERERLRREERINRERREEREREDRRVQFEFMKQIAIIFNEGRRQ
jgi:hypothetical protein